MSKQRIVYEIEKDQLSDALRDSLSDVVLENFISPFRGKLVSPRTVAEIHGVTSETVTRHARAGHIPYVREGKLYKFELSEALQWNFTRMRYDNLQREISDRIKQIKNQQV